MWCRIWNSPLKGNVSSVVVVYISSGTSDLIVSVLQKSYRQWGVGWVPAVGLSCVGCQLLGWCGACSFCSCFVWVLGFIHWGAAIVVSFCDPWAEETLSLQHHCVLQTSRAGDGVDQKCFVGTLCWLQYFLSYPLFWAAVIQTAYDQSVSGCYCLAVHFIFDYICAGSFPAISPDTSWDWDF